MQRSSRTRGGANLLVPLALAIMRHVHTLTFLPYVTLGTLAVLFYLHLSTPHYIIENTAISARRMLSTAPFSTRWLTVGVGSQLLHLDDMHLYYNALSFLHKGTQLEHPARCGAVRFGALLAVLTALTPAFYVALAVLADPLMPGLFFQQAVGFSGVIFALKVVLQAGATGEEVVGGFRVPAKLAAWAELVAIQLATPNASFLGHLAGILAGLTVVAVERASTARGAGRRR
jgi:rhomboid domain-containing protein 1